MISLLLLAASILGFVTGSLWLFTGAITALMAKMFPVLLLTAVLVGGGYLVLRHYFKK